MAFFDRDKTPPRRDVGIDLTAQAFSDMASDDLADPAYAVPLGEADVITDLDDGDQVVSDVVVSDLDKHLTTLARRIQSAKRSVVKSVLGIGEALVEARDLLATPDGSGHGSFGAWVRDKCGFGRTTAYKYISAYQRFGQFDKALHQRFDANAIYVLAPDKAPQEAVDAALALAECGEKITERVAKQLVAEHSPKPKKRTPAPKPLMIETSGGVVVVRPKDENVDVAAMLREAATKLAGGSVPLSKWQRKQGAA